MICYMLLNVTRAPSNVRFFAVRENETRGLRQPVEVWAGARLHAAAPANRCFIQVSRSISTSPSIDALSSVSATPFLPPRHSC